MPHTTGLLFANYSKNLGRLITGRNCSLLADGRQRRHFGVEIECCDYTRRNESYVDYDTAYEAINSLFEPIGADGDSNNLYDIHDDCSLWGNAFEFVTSPMTMDLLRKLNWEDFFDVIAHNDYVYNDFNSYDKAGIHVHVNKRSLKYPFEAAVNALLFITQNRNTIRRFARRNTYTWDDWCATPYWAHEGNRLNRAIEFAKAGDYSKFGSGFDAEFDTDETRYRCVNFQSSQTWELRIFNSTLRAQDMYNILDFTDALWDMCDKPNFEDINIVVMNKKLTALGNTEAADYMFYPPEDINPYEDYSSRWVENEEDEEDEDYELV